MEAILRHKTIGAVAVAAAVSLSLGACSSAGSSSSTTKTKDGSTSSANSHGDGGLATDGAGKTITIWMQSDAQGWPDVIKETNKRFTAQTGAKVKIEWQNWSNYTTKMDSMFAGSSGIPDVIEMGNTQTASYMAAGALKDLSSDKSKFTNSDSWQKGLADTASYDGKLYAVPYYGGVRVVIYRKDLWSKAGVTSPPTTLHELFSDLGKVKKANASDSKFSAFYMPGQYWYAAMTFVHGAGGTIATQDGGKWTAQLGSQKAQHGLQNWKKLATEYSTGGATKNEADQDQVMAKGHVAAIFGSGWEVGGVTDKKTGNPKLAKDLATFPMPSSTAGKAMPSFFGGSDLAIPAKASNAALGEKWISLYTDNKSQTELAKYAIPNTTSLLTAYEQGSAANKAAGEAAAQTWVTPTSPNWANVESANILQNMLENIATGKQSISTATKAADKQIDKTLNASS
jgi:N,N'-diacetylchitobiose transport system substrate-binding protein